MMMIKWRGHWHHCDKDNGNGGDDDEGEFVVE